jgi:hypothetical protein
MHTLKRWSKTDWLAEHLNDPSLRIVESNEDILLYDTGHIAGAVHIDWRRDLQDQVQRDYINPAQFAQLAGLNGIGKDTIRPHVTILESAHSKKMPWPSAMRATPSSTFDCPKNSAVKSPTCPGEEVRFLRRGQSTSRFQPIGNPRRVLFQSILNHIDYKLR